MHGFFRQFFQGGLIALEELTKLYYILLKNYQNTFYEEKIIIMALR